MLRRSLLLSLLGLPLRGSPPPRSNRVRVPVWGEGELDPSSFRVKLDGEEARIVAVRGPADDLMLLLALDFTGDFERAELAKEAAIGAVNAMRPNMAVALLRAQDGMQVLQDPTADRARVEHAIRALPVNGRAGFLDTVEPACQVADGVLTKTQVRAAVVYLTDSSIYNHRADYANPVINSSDTHDMSRRFPEGLVKQKVSSLEGKLATLQPPLFVVQLAWRTDRLEQAYQAGQLQLASGTGGSARFCRSSAEVAEAVGGALAEAVSHYTLELRLPEHRGRAVQVHIEQEGRTLTYRSRIALSS